MALVDPLTRHSIDALRGLSGPVRAHLTGQDGDVDRGDPVSTDQPPPALWRTPGRTLFVKYFVTLLIAVVAPLLLSAASEAWFGYRGQRASLNELLQVESRSATERIQTFIDGIRDQLGWVVQLPWTAGDEERHRIDALRLLRQVPAISSITLVDEMDRERAFISRQEVNRVGLGPSMSPDPAV